MNRRLVSRILSLAVALAVSGCHATPPTPPPPNPLQQIDEGGYVIKHNDVLVAEAWSNQSDGTKRTEFWAHISPLAKITSLTMMAHSTLSMPTAASTASPTCGSWWSRVCKLTPTPTYSRTVVNVSTPIVCDPPTPPPPGTGQSFLPVGSYQLSHASDAPFAWIFVQSTTEYWAMTEMIGSGTNEISSLDINKVPAAVSARYTTPAEFAAYVCKLPLPQRPSMWFAPSYSAPVPMDCAAPPGDCAG